MGKKNDRQKLPIVSDTKNAILIQGIEGNQ